MYFSQNKCVSNSKNFILKWSGHGMAKEVVGNITLKDEKHIDFIKMFATT